MTNASPGVLKVNYCAANFPTSAHGPFINGDQVIISGTGTAPDSTPGRQYLVANYSGSTFTSTLAPAVPDRREQYLRKLVDAGLRVRLFGGKYWTTEVLADLAGRFGKIAIPTLPAALKSLPAGAAAKRTHGPSAADVQRG